MAENELGIWYRSIPIITRWWFSLSIVFPLLGRLGLINMMYMLLDYASIIYRFQVRIIDSRKYLQLRKLVQRRRWKNSFKLHLQTFLIVWPKKTLGEAQINWELWSIWIFYDVRSCWVFSVTKCLKAKNNIFQRLPEQSWSPRKWCHKFLNLKWNH